MTGDTPLILHSTCLRIFLLNQQISHTKTERPKRSGGTYGIYDTPCPVLSIDVLHTSTVWRRGKSSKHTFPKGPHAAELAGTSTESAKQIKQTIASVQSMVNEMTTEIGSFEAGIQEISAASEEVYASIESLTLNAEQIMAMANML